MAECIQRRLATHKSDTLSATRSLLRVRSYQRDVSLQGQYRTKGGALPACPLRMMNDALTRSHLTLPFIRTNTEVIWIRIYRHLLARVSLDLVQTVLRILAGVVSVPHVSPESSATSRKPSS